MARELFSLSDKAKISTDGVYRFEDVLITGDTVYIDAYAMQADGSRTARLVASQGLFVFDYYLKREIPNGSKIDLSKVQLIAIEPRERSTGIQDKLIQIEFNDENSQITWAAKISLTVLELVFLADYDRDGKIEQTPPSSKKWVWGRSGTGPVLLVNSDRDTAHPSPRFRDRLDRRINGPLDLEDMTSVIVRLSGPSGLDLSGYTLRLHVSDAAASRIRIFDVSRVIPEALIGPGIPTAVLAPELQERALALEGIDYPDAGFSGLITVAVELERNMVSYGGDKLVIRVAPWVALPNTQPALRLYIAEMADDSNSAAIADIEKFADAANVELVIVPSKINREDRWLQDEIEIGYAARPGKVISVVLDSPRDRGLDDLPEAMILGPDFGYVTRGNDEERSSLDSFGNLDCTPPHRGPKGEYPFGRIIFGGAQPGAKRGRRMMKVVSDFVYAQQVQDPIELFSDWLAVGHIDEFMSFVPAPDAKGFRLVLAGPALAYQLLEELLAGGHGNARILPGKRFEMSIEQLLSDRTLRKQNESFQKAIEWNKAVLIREMGLQPSDILYVPAIYFIDSADGRAGAFFPGMVNMQVVNRHLAIPKPFGPVVNGRCVFESHVENVFGPLELHCHFIDTYEGYHLQSGEIHCGTNVVRQPFAEGWWNFDPAINSVEIAEIPSGRPARG